LDRRLGGPQNWFGYGGDASDENRSPGRPALGLVTILTALPWLPSDAKD